MLRAIEVVISWSRVHERWNSVPFISWTRNHDRWTRVGFVHLEFTARN